MSKKIKVSGSVEQKLSSRQIERVLSSGIFEGITPTVAKKLVEHFGPDAVEAISSWDVNAKKIIGDRWDDVSDQILDHGDSLHLISWLLDQGFSALLSRKAMLWVENESDWASAHTALLALKEDPYLLSEINGITFANADRVAINLGTEPKGDARKNACAREALRISCDSAGGGAKLSDAKRELNNLLILNNAMTQREAAIINESCFDLAEKNGLLKLTKNEQGESLLFSADLYEAEEKAAHLMLAMLGQENPLERGDLDQRVKELEESTGLTLHEEQRKALSVMFQGRISIICGKPGSGKTTLLKCAAPLLEAGGKKVLYAAPTGKAAKRMNQTLGRPASTLHRLLSVGKNEKKSKTSKFSAKNDLIAVCGLKDADAVVLDETSMLDSKMFLRLLRSIGPKTALILVGDPQQLPSVGAGKVLKDLIDSKTIPTAIMNKVMRQSEGSTITKVARAIGEGNWEDFRDIKADCVRLDVQEAEEIAGRIAKMLLGAAKNKYDPLKDSQILAAGNGGPAGVASLNKQLQSLLNPQSIEKEECKIKEDVILRKGDKVMHLTNDYEKLLIPVVKEINGENNKELISEVKKGVFNGDVGFVDSIKEFPSPGKIRVRFDDGIAEYNIKEAAASLTLSYACTVHKFQGSEAPLIFFVMHDSTSMMLRNRNLVYTAITRAKNKCIVFGSEHVLRQATAKDALSRRVTRLKGLLDGSITVDETASSVILALSEKQGFAHLIKEEDSESFAVPTVNDSSDLHITKKAKKFKSKSL